MKRIAIILPAALLVLAILTASACAGGILGTGNSGNGPETECETEYEAIYDMLCTEARNSAMQHSSWIFAIESESESRIMQVRNYPEGFKLPAPAGNGNIPQNIRPGLDSEQNKQIHPFFQGGSPANREVLDREELTRVLENQNRNQNPNPNQNLQQEAGSYSQAYVTPDDEAVSAYLEENGLDDKYEIYEAALSWAWVSDEALNGMKEKWLTPVEFLEETPDYSKNPIPGEPVSDCEEQANTLASLLIASEEYDESTVRVAVGEADFGEVSGGHAWVEVCEDGIWFPLDPTGGPYYDEENSELVPVDTSKIAYEEYRDSSYPAVEVWYYYNNEYFLDLGARSGDAPVSWQKLPESYQGSRSEQAVKE
ncbi:transglutaminase-like domain-containing protein [Methanosarcina sp. KYL-1]|uniref:transglutaminase-like domain-containing protein n=1 Tax=Methanosarcina sp. KYL-1 TaxID=2602068 RepID=UPI002100FDE2|nr:transglutaminase-like domain-containing protein [Methanosarcina sp. KYL-1]